MSDDLEKLLHDVLHDRGAVERVEVERLSRYVAALPPRRPDRRRSLLAAASIALALGLAGAFLGPRVGQTGATPPPPEGPVETVEPLPSSPATTPEPAPPWAGDVVGNLRCDGPVAKIGAGGDPADIAGGSNARSPEGTLSNFLATEARLYVALPLAGFDELHRTGEWVMYAHSWQARVRATVLVHRGTNADGGPWYVWTVAACDPAEFDPDVPIGGGVHLWHTEGGDAVPTTTISELADCYGGTQLRLDGRLYVRDPNGPTYDPTQLFGTYDGSATLPADAIETPYRDGVRRIHRARGDSAIFVVAGNRVERWPRVRGDDYMRTDCN